MPFARGARALHGPLRLSVLLSKFTNICSQATSSLVSGIKGEAEMGEDADQQNRLLSAAKMLADATAKLVEAAKVRFPVHNLL